MSSAFASGSASRANPWVPCHPVRNQASLFAPNDDPAWVHISMEKPCLGSSFFCVCFESTPHVPQSSLYSPPRFLGAACWSDHADWFQDRLGCAARPG